MKGGHREREREREVCIESERELKYLTGV